MIDFFEKVLGFFESFFEFFLNIVESLFAGIAVLSTSLTLPYFLIGYLPAILGSAMLIIIALAIIKFIIGR